MTTHKPKKGLKFRGQRSHGYGSHKKHRGAGHRGGRGNAGSGKRGDGKKPSFWKNTNYFGVNGFKRSEPVSAINLRQLDECADNWEKQGKIKKAADTYDINLTELGYDKLLSTGRVTKKLNITVKASSKTAIEKVNTAGGKVNLPA